MLRITCSKKLLFFLVLFIFNNSVKANCSFFKKVKKSQDEFIEMTRYIISNNYNKEFKYPILSIKVDTVSDTRIKQFCKKFDIDYIDIQGKYDYQQKNSKFVEDSVII